MKMLKGVLFFKATNITITNNVAAARWVLPEGCARAVLFCVSNKRSV